MHSRFANFSEVIFIGKFWTSKDDLVKMIDSGMDILVINLSMISKDICKEVIKSIREIEEDYDFERLIGIAIDMTGAPVRTGTFGEVCSAESYNILGSFV